MSYFPLLSNFLEKRIASNFQWNVQGSQDLEITGYTISISSYFMKHMPPLAILIDAEIYNKGNTTLELLEVDSSVTNCTGNVRADREDTPKRTEITDQIYYDKLPHEIGAIIPPNQKRPIRIFGGLLLNAAIFERTDQFSTLALWPRYLWALLGIPTMQWCKAQATLVVQPADPSVVEWYQFWNHIPYEVVTKHSGFLQSCHFDLLAKFNPDPIFDALSEKYGNKGILDPNDIDGRIITLPDGKQVLVGKLNPRLRWLTTSYDANGKFVRFGQSAAFDKNPYNTIGADGYYMLGQDLPCMNNVKNYDVYLEITPAEH